MEYTGSCYIGVVGAEIEYGEAHDSVDKIFKRQGDLGPYWVRATKGYEARQLHINNFITSHCKFMLLLDSDMVFQPDVLERMRSHGLPYVSGLYMRRRFAPIAPVWYKDNDTGYPFEPWIDPIEHGTGQLYKLGASGWGLMLIHRDVIEAVRAKVLKGEPDIIEDDCDIYPYDLPAVLRAISTLELALTVEKASGAQLKNLMSGSIQTLRNEIRPLTGNKQEGIGSDIRYPIYAKLAGFQLYGDPDAQARHIINYPVDPSDYDGQVAGSEAWPQFVEQFRTDMEKKRKEYAANLEALK